MGVPGLDVFLVSFSLSFFLPRLGAEEVNLPPQKTWCRRGKSPSAEKDGDAIHALFLWTCASPC